MAAAVAHKRRTWTPSMKARVMAYYAKHGHNKTMAHFRVAGSMINRWRHENGHAPPAVPAADSTRINRSLEATVLLRKAVALIEREIGSGGKMRSSDAYVRLALDELTHIKRE